LQAATEVPAPIVVEVYSPQPQPQELAVLIAACSRAAAPNECITSDVRSAESPLGVAIVRREGERARIELGLRGTERADWSTRDLVFQPGDDELERYRAIGFAIGTLVARRSEPPAPEVPVAVMPPPAHGAPAKPAPERSSEPPVPAAPPRSRATWIDLAGGVGLGLIPGPPRFGGALRASSELVPGKLFGLAETGYSQQGGSGDPLRVRWLTLAAGVGHPLLAQAHTLGVEARLQLVVERLAFTAFDGEQSDAASRWKAGIAAALDAHWQVAPPVGIVVSAATHLDPARTVVRSGGAPVGETPALGLSGFVGVRLKLR
jgi:hypothetical protein